MTASTDDGVISEEKFSGWADTGATDKTSAVATPDTQERILFANIG
jgi:hypothetical protein